MLHDVDNEIGTDMPYAQTTTYIVVSSVGPYRRREEVICKEDHVMEFFGLLASDADGR